MKSAVKKPRSIESNLLSFGIAVGSLLVVLVLVVFGVERALGARLERLGSATMPAQQAVTGLRHAVSRLFERQVQVLSTHSEAELAQLADRQSIERGLSESRALLDSALPEVVGREEASGAEARLDSRVHEVLGSDASLFESVKRGHATEAQFNARTASLKTSLEQLIQEARSVAGIAHLEFVLELRRVANGASPEKAVQGNARVQQEAAGQVVIAVLQLGQLVGKLGLTRNEDELNSIIANELSQNLSRMRTELRTLVGSLDDAPTTLLRAQRMQAQFESVAAQISADDDPLSLVRLRRSSVAESGLAAELREQTQKSAAGLSVQLEAVERIAANEARSAMSSARRALWIARVLSLVALAAAVTVGVHSARRLRESLRGLRAQNAQLESLTRDLKAMNEGLEGLVAERSAALALRERAMRLLLDAMSEGLVSADLDGKISGESSKVALSWFGPAPADTLIWDYLFGADTHVSAGFRVGYEQIKDDLLPFEASAACMPARFVKAGRTYSLSYRQVMEADAFQRVLAIVNDITHEVEAEERERDAREQHQLLSHLLNDKQGLQMFVRDSERLQAELASEQSRELALRALHTLKGNTAVFGMSSVARRCHELEDALRDRAGALTPAECAALSALWHARLRRIEEVLTAEEFVELDDGELGEIVQGLRQRCDHAELLKIVQSWSWLKTSALLGRLAAQVRRVAQDLGKSVDVQIEHNQLRVMPGVLDGFWGELIHVVRNAVDHGLEPEEERELLGKAQVGKIVLRSTQPGGAGLCIELSDDGGGIDFDRLRALAAQRADPATNENELIELMFRDGVTTRDAATEVSGRGVGLGAVVAACRAAGGAVDVTTSKGQGTTFRFTFPERVVQVRKSASSGTFSASPARSSETRASVRSA